MIKIQKQTIGGILVLLMLGVSPLSITYSFGEDYHDKKEKDAQKDEKFFKKGRLSLILTEKIVDGRLEVQHYTLPEELSKEDQQRILSLGDETLGWAYVNYKAFHAGIVLFDGKATKIGENMWKISSNDMVKIVDDEINLEFSEKYDDSDEVMNGSILEEVLCYRVIFSGKITETDHEDELIISFINSGLDYETSQNDKFLQIGDISINSEKLIVSHQDF